MFLYWFYCLSYITSITDTQHATFLENSEISGSTTNHNLDLQEVQEAGGNHSSVIIPPIIPLVPNAAPNITDPPSSNQNPHNLDTANAETLSVF
jgi:hypothetical protein